MDTKKRNGLLENAIAISADLHTHPDYHKFYDVVGPEVNGFPGIYDLVRELAEILSDWEDANGGADAYNDLDWVSVIEHIAQITIDVGIDGELSATPLKDIVSQAIEDVREND